MHGWRLRLLMIAALLLCSCSPGISELPLQDLKAKYASASSHLVDIDGLPIHYRDEGSGEAIIMLHGVFSSLHTWSAWSRELKPHFRIISLDLPGHGLTGPANFAYNRDNYMRFINHFAAKLGIQRFTLVGNSLGGWFAWNYAIEYPQQVKALVLVDSAGFPMDVPPPMQAYTMPVISALATHFSPKFATRMMLEKLYARPDRITDELVQRYYDMQLRPGNREASRDLFSYAEQYSHDEPEGLERITMPTLLMWGKHDPWMTVKEHLSRWRKALPKAEVVVYEDAGHIPMEEIPKRSAADLSDFLEAYLK